MTAETLSAAAGVLLSLVLAYTPGLAPRFEALAPVHKRLVLLACLLAVSAGAVGLACSPALAAAWPNFPVPCTSSGLGALASAFLSSLVASQAAYLLAPRAAD